MPQKSQNTSQEDKDTKKKAPPSRAETAERIRRATATRQREMRTKFSALAADELIINDIAFGNIPSTSISVINEADTVVTETLRTEAPHIQPKGKDVATVSLQLMFKEGHEQIVTLRRLMAELLHSPFVFLENNKVRQALFAPHAGKEGSILETMAFVLHLGSLSISQQLPGVIILDLQLSEFNYKPFSKHFWYSSTIAGIPTNFQGEKK